MKTQMNPLQSLASVVICFCPPASSAVNKGAFYSLRRLRAQPRNLLGTKFVEIQNEMWMLM